MLYNKLKYVLLLFFILSLFVFFVSKLYFRPNLGVVNVSVILAKSSKLKTVQLGNEKKLKELALWVENVNDELEDENDKTQRSKLVEQYKKLTHEKEMLIKQEYSNKLEEVNTEITNLIGKVAKRLGYDVVFANTALVIGGIDITEEVLKEMK